MFHVEFLVYLYMVVCVSMIGFNLVTIFIQRRRDQREEHRSQKLEREIRETVVLLRQGDSLPPQMFRHLTRKLSRVEWLIAFNDAISNLQETDPESAARFLQACHPVFIQLCMAYRKKESTQQAYLAWTLSRYQIARDMEMGPIVDYMKMLLHSDSIYCRENAMRAFYQFASPRATAEAVFLLDRNEHFHHGKLLTDGLLTFQGDSAALISLLWQALGTYQTQTQVAVLNYIRFCSGGYEERMLGLLKDETQHPELRYSAVRYLGKYPYEPAKALLLQMAGDRDPGRWELAAISATALSGYPGEETVTILKKALGNPNWYVRYNAAASLDRLRISYLELSDVMNGPDRYAREMLQYWMDKRQLEAETREGAMG